MPNPTVDQILHRTLLGDAWDHADVAVAVFGDDRRFVAYNEAFCRLTGYGREELKELVVGSDLAGDEETAAAYREIVRGGQTRGSGRLKRKDGGIVAVDYWVVPTTIAGLPYFISLLSPGAS